MPKRMGDGVLEAGAAMPARGDALAVGVLPRARGLAGGATLPAAMTTATVARLLVATEEDRDGGNQMGRPSADAACRRRSSKQQKLGTTPVSSLNSNALARWMASNPRSARVSARSPARLALAARERGPCFGIRDPGGSNQGRRLEPAPCLRRPRLAHVERHQRTRIEVEDQRRSSITASETDRPRTRGACARPAGLPPDHASRPLFTNVRTTASVSSAARAGAMTATGRYRSVTVIASPRCTRASTALNLSLSSRTPICAFAMALPPPLKWPHHTSMWLPVTMGERARLA